MDNIHNSSSKRPSGTSAQAGLRKLQKATAEGNEKARVELEAATSGVKSVHRACVEAGLRKETKKATEPTLAAAPPPAAVAALAPEPPAAPIVVEAAPEPPTPHLDAINFTHGGRAWTISTSRFADGRIAEIFLDTDESGEIAQLAGDAAILASLALQFGAPLATLKHAMETRGGPLAAGLAALDEGAP